MSGRVTTTSRTLGRRAGVQRTGQRRAAGQRDRRRTARRGAVRDRLRRRPARKDDSLAVLQRPEGHACRNCASSSHLKQSGQSTAVRNGVKAARGAWIATLDGDGQNDPADIPKLLAARASADPAIKLFAGWRVNRKDTGSQALGLENRQCHPLAPAARRDARHRLRHQAVRARGVPRPALLRPHAPLPAGAGASAPAGNRSACR